MKMLLLSERVSPTERMAVLVRLDKDMVTQGTTVAEAIERMQRTIRCYEIVDARQRLVSVLNDRAHGVLRSHQEPLVENGPAPEVYAKLYGMSAFWDGKAPEGWDVRIWHGDSPYQWVSVVRV